MNNTVSALTARTQLGQIIRRATQNNERFVVDRRGEPAVIIMSVRDYINTIAPTPDWLKEIGEESKRKGLNKLTMRQINAEIAASRRERRQRIPVKRPAK
jgi:prevent-host-death family protein